MAYASQAGRARTNPGAPDAHAICDRCGFRYNFRDLSFQFDWRGPTLKNLYILVCKRCEDTPQEQLRAIVLPADPVPIVYARPENYQNDSSSFMTLTPATISYPQGIPIPNVTQMTTLTGNTMGPLPLGSNGYRNPMGQLNPSNPIGDPNAQMSPINGETWATPIPITSIVASGTATLTVNCAMPHNLATGAQVAIWGVSNSLAYGIFSVIVTTATVFTYQANANVPSGTVSTASTKVITTNAGLPWLQASVPQTGV